MLQRYRDQLIEIYTSGAYYREVVRAKEEYFQKAGVIYEDDSEFDQRMNIFMDWYLFDRDLPEIDLPPVKHFLKHEFEKLSEEEKKTYEDLSETVHSLFRLVRKTFFGPKKWIVRDLFTKKKYLVSDPQLNIGFSKNDVFEARLIQIGDHMEFSGGFCFHPSEVESFILSEIKKVRHQEKSRQTKLILQLSAMKLQHLRFQHIDIHHIYQLNSKLLSHNIE